MISKAPWTPSSSHILGWNLQYRIYLSPCIWTHDLGMVIKLPDSFLTLLFVNTTDIGGSVMYLWASMSYVPMTTRGESQRFTTKPRMVGWMTTWRNLKSLDSATSKDGPGCTEGSFPMISRQKYPKNFQICPALTPLVPYQLYSFLRREFCTAWLIILL